MLDIQLPSGSAHVVLISLLHMLRELREQYSNLLVPQTISNVLVRLGVQVSSLNALHGLGPCILVEIFVVKAVPEPAMQQHLEACM